MIKIIKKKYIPHLAEFYFKPKYNWSHDQASSMYNETCGDYIDQILYKDCIHEMDSLNPE